MQFLLITTGGTIGAEPYPDPATPPVKATMPGPGNDLVANAVRQMAPPGLVRCIGMPPRDSNDIDDTYRADLLRHIQGAPEHAVLVTHGTDTIVNTAEYLQRRLGGGQDFGKSVVLTGAMTPLSNGNASDGYRNVRFALTLMAAPVISGHPVRIVLCGGTPGDWRPMTYNVTPGTLAKSYQPDGRYHHLVVGVPPDPTGP